MRYYLTQEEMDNFELLCLSALEASDPKEERAFLAWAGFACHDMALSTRTLLSDTLSVVEEALSRRPDNRDSRDSRDSVNAVRDRLRKARRLCLNPTLPS